jgi:hypothetical protein
MEFTEDEAGILIRALLKFSRTAVKQSESDIADALCERIDSYRDELVLRKSFNV